MWPTADHCRVSELTNKPTLFKFFFPRSGMKGHGGTFKVSLLSSPSGFSPKLSRIKLPFLSPVVLPPLPGQDGEIYDDVVDPNLEVRWVYPRLKQPHDESHHTGTRVSSCLVGSLVTRTQRFVPRSPAASCGCLRGADALSATKRKIKVSRPVFTCPRSSTDRISSSH